MTRADCRSGHTARHPTQTPDTDTRLQHLPPDTRHRHPIPKPTVVAGARLVSDDAKMKTPHPNFSLALCAVSLAVSAFAISACAGEAPAPSRPDPPPAAPVKAVVAPNASAQLLQSIKTEIGDAACDKDSRCASVGVGLRACGGPEVYWAFSYQVSHPARLASLVAEHRDARKREHERSSGESSDCRALLDPGAVCRPRAVDGKRVCQLGQGGQGRLD